VTDFENLVASCNGDKLASIVQLSSAFFGKEGNAPGSAREVKSLRTIADVSQANKTEHTFKRVTDNQKICEERLLSNKYEKILPKTSKDVAANSKTELPSFADMKDLNKLYDDANSYGNFAPISYSSNRKIKTEDVCPAPLNVLGATTHPHSKPDIFSSDECDSPTEETPKANHVIVNNVYATNHIHSEKPQAYSWAVSKQSLADGASVNGDANNGNSGKKANAYAAINKNKGSVYSKSYRTINDGMSIGASSKKTSGGTRQLNKYETAECVTSERMSQVSKKGITAAPANRYMNIKRAT